MLPAVTIGDASIIGAMSVVSQDITSNPKAVCSPARLVRTYDVINKV